MSKRVYDLINKLNKCPYSLESNEEVAHLSYLNDGVEKSEQKFIINT